MENAKNAKIDVSIIIVNYRTHVLVDSCLNTINEKTTGVAFEVIVIDNSTDKSEFDALLGLKKKYDFPLQVIDAKENLGFGRANNLGAIFASGEYLLFLNSDTLLLNNAVSELMNTLKENSEIGEVGPNLFLPTMMPGASYSIFPVSPLGARQSRRLLPAFFRKLFHKKTNFNKSDHLLEIKGYLIGACIMIRKNLFDEIGGFDKNIFMYSEDVLLSCEIMKKGYKLVNDPKAKIIHLEGASSENEISESKAIMCAKSARICAFKIMIPKDAERYLSELAKLHRRNAFVSKIRKQPHGWANSKRLEKAFFEEAASVKKLLRSKS